MNKAVKAELEKIESRKTVRSRSLVLGHQELTEPDFNGSKLKPLKTFKLSEIEAKPVEWLWQPFLANGTFNLLEGEEGLGKTFVTCAIATAIAAGKGLPAVPENDHVKSSNVLLISAEDSLSHVLKPRLESMKADCEKIFAIDEPFTLDQDGLLRLKIVLAEFEPKAVFIDPLFSYTGRINLNNDNEIRFITDALKKLAEDFGCCIVGIRHIGKSKGFGDVRNAGLNGVGWRAAARSVLLIGKHPENEQQKALCQTKNNLAPKYSKSIGFELRSGEFLWTGESSLTPETMLSAARNETTEERVEKNEAVEFLKEVLSSGSQPAKKVKSEAHSIGLTEQNLRTARAKIGVVVFKQGGTFGGDPHWHWKLPEDVTNNIEDAGNSNKPHLQLTQSNKTSYGNSLADDVDSSISPHLQVEIQHLHNCQTCGLSMEITPDGNEKFCPFGCGSIQLKTGEN